MDFQHNFKLNRNGKTYSPVFDYAQNPTNGVDAGLAVTAVAPDTLDVVQQVSFDGQAWFAGTAFTQATAATTEAKAMTVAGGYSRFEYEVAGVVQVDATLSTNLAGTNNDLDYTAVETGLLGNRVSIAYVDPEAETATETVTVTGRAIVVTLRSVSATLSTATQVKAAIDASAAAAALVTVANKAANDGTGSVIALAATNLASGVQVGGASLSTALTGDNNDLDIEANEDGTSGNNISVAYVDPAVAGATLSISTFEDAFSRQITVNLATGAKVASAVSTTLVGDNNDLTFTAVEAGVAGDDITIAYIDPSANNATLSMVVTGTDIVINLATGVAGAITTTANQILAIINNTLISQKLVKVTLKAGSDGTGVVTALAEDALESGSDGGAITSTGTLVLGALNAMSEEWVTAKNKSANDGSGLVTVLARSSLISGADQVAGTVYALAR